MSAARRIVGAACAAYYRLKFRGKIDGSNFIIARPSHLKVRAGGKIIVGEDVVISKDARIVVESGCTLTFGDRVYVGKNVTIIAFADVRIGAETLIAENVSIHSEDHGPASARDNFSAAPISIGYRAWLGAGVVVLKGTLVGDESTIGANAVVTKSVPNGVTAVGVPARPTRSGATPQ